MENVAPPVPARVFEISYQEFAGPHYNRVFRGEGTLTLGADGGVLEFSGKKRAVFGGRATRSFSPDDIWNVTVEGRRVQFVAGSLGAKHPFVFFAKTPEAAAEIGTLLPQRKDADAIASAEFSARLRELPAPATSWGWITNLIIGANVAVFVLMALQGAGWFEVTSMMPYIRYGANRADVTTDGEWWRLGASMFLHYGLVHLLLNMYALLQVGHLVERLYGRALYTVLYFGSGIAGSVASLLWHSKQLVWSAGASGAVFGVYGALLGYMLRERQALPRAVFQPLLKSTLLFAGYNLLYGLSRAGIDNAGHVGGFAGGALLGALLALPLDREARPPLVPRRLQLGAGAIVAIVALGVALSPRFDYHLTDELAMERANHAPTQKEPDVLKRQQAALAAYAAKPDAVPLSRWLKDEAIPFYTSWRDELVVLKLPPGTRTVRRRDGLVNILGMKVESFAHLRAALDGGEADALEKFRAEERKIAAELKAFTTGPK